MPRLATRAFRRLVLISMLATLALGAGAGPAAAYTSQQSGLVGPYSYVDSSLDPMASCGYKDPGIDNWIWIDWVRVKAPTVFAADRSSEKIESRRVTFQMKIQRHYFGSSDPWKVVAQSPIQSSRAYENQAASFSPIKLFYTPSKTLQNGQAGQFRAMVIIKWIKKSGAVEGSVKLWPSFYKEKSPYGDQVSDNGYCAAVDTDG